MRRRQGSCHVNAGAHWKLMWGRWHADPYGKLAPWIWTAAVGRHSSDFDNLAEEYSADGARPGSTRVKSSCYSLGWNWRLYFRTAMGAKEAKMRRAARVDSNQARIVEALRAAGCKVQSLASLGDGIPDLLVGYCEVIWLMEIKDGDKPPSKQKLTEKEAKFHREWSAYPTVVVVHNAHQALTLIGAV